LLGLGVFKVSSGESGSLPCYKFADLTIDVGQRRVTRGDDTLELGKLTFDFLRVLVESSPNVVTHDELADKVWGGRSVSPETISQRMLMLRQSLSDDAERPRYVEVLRGQGYRLIGEAHRSGAMQSKPTWLRRNALVALILLLGVGITVVLVRSDYFSPTPATASVAVLPFENLSPNPDDAYFSAGIHEELINRLGQIEALDVIARTSVMQYAGRTVAIAEVGEELNVNAVLEGSVRYSEDRIRITAQLIDAETELNLWSDTYDRRLGEIFAIQSEIAENIANALAAELTPIERDSIRRELTNSPEAYELYLRAIRMQGPGLPALGYFTVLDQAIMLDPQFATAYSARAWGNTQSLLLDLGDQVNFQERRAALEQRVLDDIETAIALDEATTSAALTQLARIHQYNWRASAAMETYERAYEANSNDPTMLAYYATFLAQFGEHAEAIRIAERAVELAPRAQQTIIILANVLQFAGRLEAALATYETAIELSPATTNVAQTNLALLHVALGNRELAERNLKLAESFAIDGNPLLLTQIAYGYSRLGLDEDVDRVLGAFEQAAEGGTRVADIGWAIASLARHDEERTLEWLQRVTENRPYEGYNLIMRIKGNIDNDPILNRPELAQARQTLGTI
jgi:TolB-like protein/DNA-binding winged helix-turn-helix (wHTH) protein